MIPIKMIPAGMPQVMMLFIIMSFIDDEITLIDFFIHCFHHLMLNRN